MDNEEEYLDDLLSSLSELEGLEEDENNKLDDMLPGMEGQPAEETEQFLKDFEQELAKDTDEDFLSQFEMELDAGGTETPTADTAGEQTLFDNIDGIVDGDGQEAEPAVQPEHAADFSDTMAVDMPVDTAPDTEIPDITGEESDEDFMALLSGMTGSDELADVGPAPVTEESAPVAAASGSSEDLFGLDNLDALADAGLDGLESMELPAGGTDEPTASKNSKKDNKSDKKNKKEKKDGFWSNLSLILFGEDEEDELSPENENAALLKELDAAGETDAGAIKPEDPKEKKKREKAEKKELKKQEKEAKKAEKAEKAAKKPKKEKKPKAPKEKDNTPPLPKKPVILITVMAASIFALILLGSNAVGYSVAKGSAKDAYAAGDYVKAYTELAGYEIKEKDEEFFYKVGLLATLQEQYNTYQSMMAINENEMALDCLIRGVGRYYKNIDDAVEYGAASEFERLKNQMVQELNDTFGVNEEQAQAVYNQRGRKNYTLELKNILNGLGME